MKKFFITAFALLGAAFWSFSAAADGHMKGGHVLTVVGNVSNPNRPAFDGFHDAFLKYNDYSFENAYGFDHAMLMELPQAMVKAQGESWPGEITFKGPKLKDVMAAAGVADDAGLTFVALDGYSAIIENGAWAAEEWVIALEADGKPLNIGGRGPAWLVKDTAGEVLEDESGWVWAMFLIVVE